MSLCMYRKAWILGAYVRHKERWEVLHRLAENVALRSIKYRNKKRGVCKVANYSECVSWHQTCLWLFDQAQIPDYASSLSTALPFRDQQKKHIICKNIEGGGKPPPTIQCFSPPLYQGQSSCVAGLLASTQYNLQIGACSEVESSSSAALCHTGWAAEFLAELQCAALLTALYKQFPALVMPDGPNSPYAKPCLQHI